MSWTESTGNLILGENREFKEYDFGMGTSVDAARRDSETSQDGETRNNETRRNGETSGSPIERLTKNEHIRLCREIVPDCLRDLFTDEDFEATFSEGHFKQRVMLFDQPNSRTAGDGRWVKGQESSAPLPCMKCGFTVTRTKPRSGYASITPALVSAELGRLMSTSYGSNATNILQELVGKLT